MTITELSNILSVNLPESLIGKIERVDGEPHFNLYVSVDHAYELMKFLHDDAGIYHLSTVTGMEIKDKEFQLVYHLQYRDESKEKEVPINVFITGIDIDNPKSPSMSSLYVCAEYYEREVYDFYGIMFTDHPFLERIILPEKWPDDVRPMRKKYSWQDIKQITINLAKTISED